MPTEPEVFLVPNEYDPNRSHLVIYNWGRASRVSVDLAPVLAEGAPYRVQSARTLYGEPVAEGYFSGLVSIPTNNEEFLVFVVLAESRYGLTDVNRNDALGSRLEETFKSAVSLNQSP